MSLGFVSFFFCLDLGSDRVYAAVRDPATNPADISGEFFVWNPELRKLLFDESVGIKSFSLELYE